MHEEGRDIGPDEEILNYEYPSEDASLPANDDLQEDTIPLELSDRETGFRLRPRFLVHEPLDNTPDSYADHLTPTVPTHRVSNAPEYYKSEVNRLSTFTGWHYQNVVRKEDLAKDGFVYTGSGDTVRCVFCEGRMRQWDVGDVVRQEHSRVFPQCPFLRGVHVGNIPLELLGNLDHVSAGDRFGQVTSQTAATYITRQGHDLGLTENRGGRIVNGLSASGASRNAVNSSRHLYTSNPKNQYMSVEAHRLETFKTWPSQMKQRASQLVQAGLYYTGDGDKVKCFHCDGLLYSWEPEDNPFVEHAQWFPHCEYIRLIKGEKFVQDVQSGNIEKKDEIMESPAVLAVMFEGASEEEIQKALMVIRNREGTDENLTAEKLLKTIMDLGKDQTCGDKLPVTQEMEKLQVENESLKDKQLCKVCMENEIDAIFYPCKHVVCCASCSTALKECPICRLAITGVDKIFIS